MSLEMKRVYLKPYVLIAICCNKMAEMAGVEYPTGPPKRAWACNVCGETGILHSDDLQIKYEKTL